METLSFCEAKLLLEVSLFAGPTQVWLGGRMPAIFIMNCNCNTKGFVALSGVARFDVRGATDGRCLYRTNDEIREATVLSACASRNGQLWFGNSRQNAGNWPLRHDH